MDQTCQVCIFSYLLHTAGTTSRLRKCKFNYVYLKENEILQRITALRREGLWSLKRLPKLQETPRHKSHHDYLLEEMQWMATDFVQERRWKMITDKRVVDSKLQVELEERRKKALNSQYISKKGYMADLADIVAAAEALLPKGSAQITTAVRSDTLSLLCGTFRDYQKAELEWLAKLYKMNLSGILADEVGLGKTLQVVAFFAHLVCNEGSWGPILVVSQNFNVLKREMELKSWCPALKILLYLGKTGQLFKKRQEWTDPNNFNICIASCKQFFKDYEAFMKVQWRYLVLDERQNVIIVYS
ncbi:unnamed protein product [Bubo scandiacus]